MTVPTQHAVATGARASLRPEPPLARIGQSVTWTLTVQHPVGSTAQLGGAFAEADLGWAEEALGTVYTAQVPGTDGMLTTSLTWTGMPLEPGNLAPPAGEVSWSGPEGRRVLEPRIMVLKVNGELAPGEDVPRTPAGLESAIAASPGTDAGPSPFAVPLASFLMAAVVLVAVIALRHVKKGQRKALVPAPAPREALARLRAAQSADPGDTERSAARLAELSRILRRAADLALDAKASRASGSPSPLGLTDNEWLRRLAEERVLAPEEVGAAGALFSSIEATRFSRRVPTRFAVERMLEQGQILLDNLERAAARGETPDRKGAA